MKWPRSITLIRHAQSAYNILKALKKQDQEYKQFKKAFYKDHQSAEAKALAEAMRQKYALNVNDAETPLTEEGRKQAFLTGQGLSAVIPRPEIIFYSPYLRTKETLEQIKKAWPALADVRSEPDDRIREQEHGLSCAYNDWRIFQVFHPEQKFFHKLQGPYWYQYPQGESVSQVRDRIRLWTGMLIRECAGMHVLAVTHHLTMLSIRANFEALMPDQFIELDKTQKPVNCGITHYECDPYLGRAGKMKRILYNHALY